mmetsp:Transcript_30232/g.93278  ORF Transcript_30232/g.93278 Transcript_30232/m.93278 type:complete len:170 (+) Transcript_30232:1242-1751(+)
MCVQIPSRKPASCETTIRIFGRFCFSLYCTDKYDSSQITAFKSRWFVGSSSIRTSGSMNTADASAIRFRQPPEKDFVGRSCHSVGNPRPNKIRRARASACSEPMIFSSSSMKFSLSSSLASSSSFVRSFSASSKYSKRFLWLRTTASTAEISSPVNSCSCSTRRMSSDS